MSVWLALDSGREEGAEEAIAKVNITFAMPHPLPTPRPRTGVRMRPQDSHRALPSLRLT